MNSLQWIQKTTKIAFMNLNSFEIAYPESYPGTEKTQINFYSSTPDLVELYKPGKTDERRCFVTDATVATLPCVVPFIDCFEDGKCGNDILIILGRNKECLENYYDRNVELALTSTSPCLLR